MDLEGSDRMYFGAGMEYKKGKRDEYLDGRNGRVITGLENG